MKFVFIEKLPAGTQMFDDLRAILDFSSDAIVFSKVNDRWCAVATSDDLIDRLADVGIVSYPNDLKTNKTISDYMGRLEKDGQVIGLIPEFAVAGQSTIKLATENYNGDLSVLEQKSKILTTQIQKKISVEEQPVEVITGIENI